MSGRRYRLAAMVHVLDESIRRVMVLMVFGRDLKEDFRKSTGFWWRQTEVVSESGL